MKIVFLFFIAVTMVQADIGRVSKAGDGAFLQRNGKKIQLVQNFPLKPSDEIHTAEAKVYLSFPSVQVLVMNGSELSIADFQQIKAHSGVKIFLNLALTKGRIKVVVSGKKGEEVELKVDTKDVVLSAGNADFEIGFNQPQEISMSVQRHQVDVSSPHIQSFVPEIVKENESLIFDMKKKIFKRSKTIKGSRKPLIKQ